MSFEKRGMVSIWVGQILIEPGSDFLKEGFGVDDYDLDFQDCIHAGGATPLAELVQQLSYSASFGDDVVKIAQGLGVKTARWVMAQYDFAYAPPKTIATKLPDEPRFIGVFSWHK
jgi:hypothetical protein